MLNRRRVDWRTTWLVEVFSHAPCAECGHGAEHHEAINVNGQPFARCLLLSSRSQGEVFERQWAKGEGQ